MSQIFLVQIAGTTLSLDNQVITLAQGAAFDVSGDVALNTAHRTGDGSDHADVALNTAHRAIVAGNPHGTSKADVSLGNVTDDAQMKRSAGDYQAFTQKINVDGTESLISEDGADGENKKRITVDGVYTYFLSLLTLAFQPLSTALSKITEAGGLPLWDGGAWPGGGGGGGWATVREVSLSGLTQVLFDSTEITDTYKEYRLVWENVVCNGVMRCALGYGVTPTYLGSVASGGVFKGSNFASTATFTRAGNQPYVTLSTNVGVTYFRSGQCKFLSLRNTGIKLAILQTQHGVITDTNSYQVEHGNRRVTTSEIINTMLISPSLGGTFTAGTLKLEAK